jgi:regulation of enolase protein 1 (concanavalin A-like superfamily)
MIENEQHWHKAKLEAKNEIHQATGNSVVSNKLSEGNFNMLMEKALMTVSSEKNSKI